MICRMLKPIVTEINDEVLSRVVAEMVLGAPYTAAQLRSRHAELLPGTDEEAISLIAFGRHLGKRDDVMADRLYADGVLTRVWRRVA